MRAQEFITELRNRGLFRMVKQILPTWPDYVLKDWVYNHMRAPVLAGDVHNINKEYVLNMIADSGLKPDTKWTYNPKQQFTMDMFTPTTKLRLQQRAGGRPPVGFTVPDDAKRHATQAAFAQRQGGVRSEPVILIKRADGYELLEGWHRTIQHFASFPQGYVGPAYIGIGT